MRGLSGTDELFHRMILDNTRVTRETRDVAIKSHTQIKELRYDHLRLSQQVDGLDVRMWHQEEATRAMQKQLNEVRPRQKSEGWIWLIHQTWGLFTPAQKLSAVVLMGMVVFGQAAPKDIKSWLLGLIGESPQSDSMPQSGSEPSSSLAIPSFR